MTTRPVPTLPAELKAKILQLAFEPRIKLSTLHDTACRLALTLCKGEMKQCLNVFVPRLLFYVKFVRSRSTSEFHQLQFRFFKTPGVPTMEFDKQHVFGSEVWAREFSFQPLWKQGNGGRGAYLAIPGSITLPQFGEQCVTVLRLLYPKLVFTVDISFIRPFGDFAVIRCVGIKCNIPVIS